MFLQFPFSFYITLDTIFLTTTLDIKISCICVIELGHRIIHWMITPIYKDPNGPLQYQSSAQKEKWVLLSETVQPLDNVQVQLKESFSCSIFPSESRRATNFLNNGNAFWDLKHNQHKLKYNQVLLYAIQNDTILHTTLNCTKWYVNMWQNSFHFIVNSGPSIQSKWQYSLNDHKIRYGV